MNIERHMSITEAKNEIASLENELDLYATKKQLNFQKTQPGAAKIKDIIVDSSHVNIDSFLNYVSRDEEYDTKIYSLLASIYAYKKYIANELLRMSKYDEISYIRYLKYEEKKTWREIDDILHRGYDYSRTKYKRYLKETSVNSN